MSRREEKEQRARSLAFEAARAVLTRSIGALTAPRPDSDVGRALDYSAQAIVDGLFAARSARHLTWIRQVSIMRHFYTFTEQYLSDEDRAALLNLYGVGPVLEATAAAAQLIVELLRQPPRLRS